MPCAKSKYLDLARQLREEKPALFGSYTLAQIAGAINSGASVEIAEAMNWFGVREVGPISSAEGEPRLKKRFRLKENGVRIE